MNSRIGKKYFIKCLLPVLWLGCQAPRGGEDSREANLYRSQDFTAPGEFTSGIEGPATDGEGNIYVVNYGREGTIGKVNRDGKSSLFINLPDRSTGNGIRLDNQGNMFVADYTGHNVLKINVFLKEIDVHVHSDGMNQPNDLAISKTGIIYASDPDWQASTGNLWRIDTDGSLTLLEDNMGTTNGLELSPDEKILYVNESVQLKVWAYDLSPAGELSGKRLFIDFTDFGMDGMRCDVKGNIYITRHGKGTVAMVSPEGKILREIRLRGKKPSNITFGGEDGKTAYVTLQDRGNLESFRVEYPGREWKLRQKQ